MAWTTPEPAKSTAPWPEVPGLTELGEEATAPDPVAVDRVEHRAHRDLGHEEPGEGDPLGDGTDDDVAGGLHEHDLEQEERHDADVIGAAALEEEALEPDQPTASRGTEVAQGAHAAEVRHRRDTAELEGESDGVIRDEGDRERRDVHHHHVAGVLRPGQAGDQEGEAHLHEQHEEPGEQQPGEVDRDPEVAGLVGQLVQARPARRVRPSVPAGAPVAVDVVVDPAGVGAGGVPVVAHEWPRRRSAR